MRKILANVVPFLLVALFFIIVFGLAFAIVAALALALGYLLTIFLPFGLFEATLLGTLFAAIALYLLTSLLNPFAPKLDDHPLGRLDGFLDEAEPEYKRIAPQRFYKRPADRTWAAWLQHQIANDIYIEFQSAHHMLAHMSDLQVQELAIRIAEFAIAILRRKRAGTRDLALSVAALKREMKRAGQQAYDNDILRLAVEAINLNTRFFEDELQDVLRDNAWDAPADVVDEED